MVWMHMIWSSLKCCAVSCIFFLKKKILTRWSAGHASFMSFSGEAKDDGWDENNDVDKSKIKSDVGVIPGMDRTLTGDEMAKRKMASRCQTGIGILAVILLATIHPTIATNPRLVSRVLCTVSSLFLLGRKLLGRKLLKPSPRNLDKRIPPLDERWKQYYLPPSPYSSKWSLCFLVFKILEYKPTQLMISFLGQEWSLVSC